ncbi:hypothetical protein ACFE04_021871 [Oxalis oulophora]
MLKDKCERPSEMILKAKMHLAFLDSSFWYDDKGDRHLMGIDEDQMQDQKRRKRRGRSPRPENNIIKISKVKEKGFPTLDGDKNNDKKGLNYNVMAIVPLHEKNKIRDLTMETTLLAKAENNVKEKVNVRKRFKNRNTMLSRLIKSKIVAIGDRVVNISDSFLN